MIDFKNPIGSAIRTFVGCDAVVILVVAKVPLPVESHSKVITLGCIVKNDWLLLRITSLISIDLDY